MVWYCVKKYNFTSNFNSNIWYIIWWYMVWYCVKKYNFTSNFKITVIITGWQHLATSCSLSPLWLTQAIEAISCAFLNVLQIAINTLALWMEPCLTCITLEIVFVLWQFASAKQFYYLLIGGSPWPSFTQGWEGKKLLFLQTVF